MYYNEGLCAPDLPTDKCGFCVHGKCLSQALSGKWPYLGLRPRHGARGTGPGIIQVVQVISTQAWAIHGVRNPDSGSHGVRDPDSGLGQS